MPSKKTRFEILLEAVPDALVGMDQKGVIHFVNRQTESLFGYDRDQLIGQSIETLVPEPLWQIYAQNRDQYFADPRTRSMGLEVELTGRRHDGSEFPLNISISHIDTGDVLLVITAVADVTRRDTAVRNAEILATVVEYSNDAIIGSTLAGTVTSWNPAAERLYGYSSREIVGRTVSLLAPGGRKDEIAEALARVRQGQTVEHLETSRVRKDGTSVTVSVTVAPIHDENGVIVGESGVHRDVTEQKKARETAQRMAAIVEGSDDAIISRGEEGTITSWNPGAERMLGYSSDEMMGRSARVLVPEDRVGELDALVKRVTSGSRIGHLETVRLRKDGTSVPVSLTISPIYGEGGAPVGAATIARDVTEQRQALESAQRLASIVDGSQDAIIGRSPTGLITSWNAAAERLYGYSAEEIVGKPISLLHPEGQSDDVDAILAKIAAGRPVEYNTHMHVRKDGTVFPVSRTISPILDADGTVVGASVVHRDRTEQVQAERALAEASLQYRLLAENASDMVFMAGPDRRIVWIAPSVTAVLGWDPEELVGTELTDLLRPDYKIAVAQDTKEFYRGHDVNPEGGYVLELRTKSGDYRWMSGHAHALTDPDGTPAGVVAGVRDVNDLVKAREEAQGLSSALKDSNDSLRDFVAVASHDLRSPLVIIGGFAKILTDNWAKLSEEDRLKHLGAIKRGVDRLSRLTNDLLTSAKVEGAAEQPQPEHIRLATALDSYLEADREELGTVTVTCPPEVVAVVDPAHLTRILDNYLGNAFKYGEPPIYIEAERVGDFVELRVRDHGPGVPPESVSQLFTKFDRVDTPTTRATQGTGLGLSIVKTLAEANHGDARYQQDDPNGGCFIVRLPAVDA